VSCPRTSLPFVANAADRQATDNKGQWPDGDVAAMAATFGIGS
jgi:hypothetical protein